MKEKLFDLILVTMLLLVAFAVGLTLFGPSFRPGNVNGRFNFLSGSKNNEAVVSGNEQVNSNKSSDMAAIAENKQSSDTVSVVVPNVDLPPNPEASTTASNPPSQAQSNPTPAENLDDTNREAAATTRTNSNTVAAASEPLPDGAIGLKSIGFSYVTGGAGACGITLEAWKHIAVSRDILAKYPCGTRLTIKIDKEVNGHRSFTAIVGDTMNKKHVKTVNIYVAKSEPALKYGRQSGNLIP